MKLCRLLKRDVILGTGGSWYKFLVVVFIVFFYSQYMGAYIASGIKEGTFFQNGSTMDYLLWVTQGMKVFHFSPNHYFEIPIYWFAFQIGIAYIVAYYPEKDFKNYGKVVFPATGSKITWWISKCIWVVFNVILYFAVLLLAVMAVAKLHGAAMTWEFSEEIMAAYFGGNMQYLFAQDAWLLSIFLPCLMTVALALVQMILSFVLTPVVSFALSCSVYIFSAYYTEWFLPGNYTMWMRSSYLNAEGINPESGIVIAVILIVSSVFAGCVYFDRCDII